MGHAERMNGLKLSIAVLVLRFSLGLTVCLPVQALDYSAADLDGDGYLTSADLRILSEEKSTRAGVRRGDVDGNGRDHRPYHREPNG